MRKQQKSAFFIHFIVNVAHIYKQLLYSVIDVYLMCISSSQIIWQPEKNLSIYM